MYTYVAKQTKVGTCFI